MSHEPSRHKPTWMPPVGVDWTIHDTHGNPVGHGTATVLPGQTDTAVSTDVPGGGAPYTVYSIAPNNPFGSGVMSLVRLEPSIGSPAGGLPGPWRAAQSPPLGAAPRACDSHLHPILSTHKRLHTSAVRGHLRLRSKKIRRVEREMPTNQLSRR